MGYSFLQLAKDVLEFEGIPLTAEEMWKSAERNQLLEQLDSSGKTPIRTLSAQIYVNLKKPDTVFVQVSKRPAKFFLRDKTADLDKFEKAEEKKTETVKIKERDLHILLSSFVNADQHFKCPTKTLHHETSKRSQKGRNKWLHPDLVGIHFPFDSYMDNTLRLLETLKVNPYRLFAFEMKINLDFANLREYYFQAVSNSSWAHEGYLVTLNIDENPDFMDELRRLCGAFGIGVIKLNPEHFMQSEILFSAKEKEFLDWETINRLVEENKDFKEFLDDLMEDIKIGKTKSTYDKVFEEETEACQYAIQKGMLQF